MTSFLWYLRGLVVALRVQRDAARIARMFYTGVHADDAGDSSAATNRIDSTIAPADQLSPGSVGVLRANIEGIVR
jgi:hypothetical protein